MDNYVKQALFTWEYGLYRPAMRVLGISVIVGHFGLYCILAFLMGYNESFLWRFAAIALAVPLLFFPRNRPLNKLQKSIFEAAMAVGLPGLFTYHLLLNEVNLFWAAALIFALMIYGVLTKFRISVVAYPVAVIVAIVIYFNVYGYSAGLLRNAMQIQLIGLLTYIISQASKVALEASHIKFINLKQQSDYQKTLLSAFMEISGELSRIDDLDDIFNLLLHRFATIFPSEKLALVVTGPRANVVQNFATIGMSEQEQHLLLEEHFSEADRKVSPQRMACQIFSGKIKVQTSKGHVTYLLQLFIFSHLLREQDVKMLNVFMEQIKGMVRTRIQAEELERYANTDHMTGLYNRLYFETILDQWAEQKDYQEEFSVIYCDINSLKHVNDTYGHQAGDLLIRGCCWLIKDSLRKSDLVFRLGGDEIVVLCPQTDYGDAELLVQRVRKAEQENSIEYIDEDSGEAYLIPINISMGIACSTETDMDQVVELADKRMYENKQDWYRSQGKKRRT